MSPDGTRLHLLESGLPPLVARAVETAETLAFPNSSRPGHARLLQALAAARPGGMVGEAGTGCGVGLAWMVTLADPSTRFVSVELDPGRAAAVAALFADVPNVTTLEGDWSRLAEHAPFDLLVLDGGGSGKQDGEYADPRTYLKPNGTVVIDDFSPVPTWPPTLDGKPDEARLHWLEHPDLLATEVQVGPGAVTILATRKP
jgi:predicted O-methyltransferase YrrM